MTRAEIVIIEAIRQQFWSLQAALNTMTALAPDYADSCRIYLPRNMASSGCRSHTTKEFA